MEEIREAALAYYANFSEKQKKSALDFFQKMDSNGDGKISMSEYMESLKQKGYKRITNSNFFSDLDTDGDGYLDFDDVITLHYLCISGRLLYCDGCSIFLKGLYFTCVQCFKSRSSYDLCSSCYRNKNYEHHDDASFYDNYTLLQTKALTSNQETLKKAISTIEFGLDMGNLVVSSEACNIL